MGTTGLIYAAIVAAWAAYLVPLWLRRHDEVSRQKSLERYSSAMRVLSRETDSGRYVARRRDEPPRVLAPSPKRSAAQFRARRAAALRRRRVLSLLLLTWASVGALAVFEMVPRWAAGVPAVLIVTFLVLVRRTVRRARKMQPAPGPARKAQRLDVSYAYGSSVAEPEPTVEVKTSSSSASSGASASSASSASSADEPAASEEGLWDPVPVTLPIYVYKEKAPSRTVRTISLPGTEFASPVEAPEPVAQPEPAPPPAPPRPSMEELDEPTQIARAVGD
jgi:hypothetical protein